MDKLDASESLRKDEEQVAEPTPIVFGKWKIYIYIYSFPGPSLNLDDFF